MGLIRGGTYLEGLKKFPDSWLNSSSNVPTKNYCFDAALTNANMFFKRQANFRYN